MPMSFSLFTFDFLGALRHARHETLQDMAEADIDWVESRRDAPSERRRAVDEAKFWGIESVPVA